MRLLRISLAVLGLLVVICGLAVLALLLFVNPNKLKPVIAEAVMKRTGYQLIIDGDLSWAFYPRFSVKMAHVTLTAPQQSHPFLDMYEVKAAAKLSQLWKAKENLGGKVYIDHIKLMNMTLEKVDVGLRWQNKVLALQPIKATLYGGLVEGVAHGSQLAAIPHWDWDIQFNQVQLKPLLQDLNGPDAKLRFSGTGQVKLQGETEGRNKEQILSHLNGNGAFNLSQGVLEGVNLNYFVQTAEALLNQQDLPALTNLNQTDFDGSTGTVSIKDGVVSTRDFTLVSPAFITKGEGSLVLLSQAIDFQLRVKPQQHDNAVSKKEWEIPVLMTGNLQQPDVRLNKDELRKSAIGQEIDKAKTKARTIIEEHVSGKAGAFLQHLLRD